MKNVMKKVGVLFVGSAAIPAMAAGANISSLTSAVDFSDVTTGIMAVAVAIVGVYVTYKACAFVFRAIRGF